MDSIGEIIHNGLKRQGFNVIGLLKVREYLHYSREGLGMMIVNYTLNGYGEYSTGGIRIAIKYGKNELGATLSTSSEYGAGDERSNINLGNASGFLAAVKKNGVQAYGEKLLNALLSLQKPITSGTEYCINAIKNPDAEVAYPVIIKVLKKAFNNIANYQGIPNIKVSSSFWRECKTTFQVLMRKDNAFMSLIASADNNSYKVCAGTGSNDVVKQVDFDDATLRRLANELYVREEAEINKMEPVKSVYETFVNLCK